MGLGTCSACCKADVEVEELTEGVWICASCTPPEEGEAAPEADALVCSFCGKKEDEVRKLIAGPTVYICDECIDLCNDIIAEASEHQLPRGTPERVVLHAGVGAALASAHLPDPVRGRLQGVLTASTLARRDESGDLQGPLSILITGPTGSGKTHLARRLADQGGGPCISLSSLVPFGVYGRDLDAAFIALLQRHGHDIEKAQQGLVVLDDLEAVRLRSDPALKAGLIGELRELLDGGLRQVPPSCGRRNPYEEFLNINTTRIGFLLVGRFDPVDPDADWREALAEQGLDRALLARIGWYVQLDPPDRERLRAILAEGDDSILGGLRRRAASAGFALEIPEERIARALDEAASSGIGIWSLVSFANELLAGIPWGREPEGDGPIPVVL